MLVGLKQFAAISVATLPVLAFAQGHSGFPVDIVAGPNPQPVTVNGRTALVYELHMTNYASLPIQVTGIKVSDEAAHPLADYVGAGLSKIVIPVESLSSAGELPSEATEQTIAEGHSVLIFIDILLEAHATTPRTLKHEFSFSVPFKDKPPYQTTLRGPVVPVAPAAAAVLSAPLRGSGWIATSAFSNGASPDHRRAMNAFDGKERIPQRFAIDWVRIDTDGTLFHGDSKANRNFYAYGAEVLAVADGRVSDLKDSLPENEGTTKRSDRAITIDNVFGNYVILDIGHGRFAAYAHLQPGSLRVKMGDKVRAGQVIALLGNSGNSGGPHLHFQLSDANSPLGSEGIPYGLSTFTSLGVVADPETLDAGQSWQPTAAEKPRIHLREFPADRTVLAFPN